MSATHATDTTAIATPRGGDSFVSKLLRSQGFLDFTARAAWFLNGLAGGPVRVGSVVVAVSHADVSDVFARDLDFLIAPINADRIQAVNGPFVLGMDRDTVLVKEREALYSALRQVDRTALAAQVAAQAQTTIAGANGSLDVVNAYARPIAASSARFVFGLNGQDDRQFMDVARAIFAHTFLNLGGDKPIEQRALRAAALMSQWFRDEIARRVAAGEPGDDMMGGLIKDRLLTTHDGHLDQDAIRRTLGGMLVGAIDTTATAVAKIVAVLGKDRDLYKQMHADRADAAKMTMWCLETLRRWPHNPLVLRRAAVDTTLGGTNVKAGDTIVALTQAAMHDPNIFADPDLLRPDRPRAAYLHYGSGLHPCAGRAINDFQITTLVAKILERGFETTGSIVWAGPFPDELIVHFTRS